MSLVVDTAGVWWWSRAAAIPASSTRSSMRATTVRNAPVFAALGGFHLFAASDETLDWTAGKLRGMGLENLLGAHCTGIEAVYVLRSRLNLDRRHCVVGAVGAGFDLDTGIQAGAIAH